jgi:hypothetical protein
LRRLASGLSTPSPDRALQPARDRNSDSHNTHRKPLNRQTLVTEELRGHHHDNNPERNDQRFTSPTTATTLSAALASHLRRLHIESATPPPQDYPCTHLHFPQVLQQAAPLKSQPPKAVDPTTTPLRTPSPRTAHGDATPRITFRSKPMFQPRCSDLLSLDPPMS